MNIKYKVIIAIGVFALIAAGCNKTTPTPAASNTQSQPPATGQLNQPSTTPPITQDESKVTAQTVTYTDSGFAPASLTIKKGDTVVFKNTASDGVRVSSNPHPLHNGYPTTGGCVTSTFDSCSNVTPGQSWSFKFDITGSWGYHNHLNSSERGTIVVQ